MRQLLQHCGERQPHLCVGGTDTPHRVSLFYAAVQYTSMQRAQLGHACVCLCFLAGVTLSGRFFHLHCTSTHLRAFAVVVCVVCVLDRGGSVCVCDGGSLVNASWR